MNLAGDAITVTVVMVRHRHVGDAFNAVVVAVADVLSSPRSRARRQGGRVGR